MSVEPLRRAIEAAGWRIRVSERSMALVSEVNSFQPDMVLLDVNMPGFGGAAAARLLSNLADSGKIKPVHIVVVSGIAEELLAKTAADVGAAGYVSKLQGAGTIVAYLSEIMRDLGVLAA